MFFTFFTAFVPDFADHVGLFACIGASEAGVTACPPYGQRRCTFNLYAVQYINGVAYKL